jgi:hypothetical protein
MRGRPPLGRRGGIGKNGSTRSHNGSEGGATAMAVQSTARHLVEYSHRQFRGEVLLCALSSRIETIGQGDESMNMNTLLIIVVVVLLLGGGGFYFGR